MYIIQLTTFNNGSRPSLQTWNYDTPPEGYAFVSQEFYDIFYSTTPAGYVNIEVEDNQVVSMTINEEALTQAQQEMEELRKEQEETALQPTQLDRIEAQVTYTAMATDTLIAEAATLDLHSAWFNKISLWYQQGLWTITMLAEAVEKNILAQDEADEIINNK